MTSAPSFLSLLPRYCKLCSFAPPHAAHHHGSADLKATDELNVDWILQNCKLKSMFCLLWLIQGTSSVPESWLGQYHCTYVVTLKVDNRDRRGGSYYGSISQETDTEWLSRVQGHPVPHKEFKPKHSPFWRKAGHSILVLILFLINFMCICRISTHIHISSGKNWSYSWVWDTVLVLGTEFLSSAQSRK